jgi:hypothetical protein
MLVESNGIVANNNNSNSVSVNKNKLLREANVLKLNSSNGSNDLNGGSNKQKKRFTLDESSLLAVNNGGKKMSLNDRKLAAKTTRRRTVPPSTQFVDWHEEQLDVERRALGALIEGHSRSNKTKLNSTSASPTDTDSSSLASLTNHNHHAANDSNYDGEPDDDDGELTEDIMHYDDDFHTDDGEFIEIFDPSLIFIAQHNCFYWDSRDRIRKGKIFLTANELFFKCSRMPFIKVRVNLRDVLDVVRINNYKHKAQSVLSIECQNGKSYAFYKFRLPKNIIRNIIVQLVNEAKRANYLGNCSSSDETTTHRLKKMSQPIANIASMLKSSMNQSPSTHANNNGNKSPPPPPPPPTTTHEQPTISSCSTPSSKLSSEHMATTKANGSEKKLSKYQKNIKRSLKKVLSLNAKEEETTAGGDEKAKKKRSKSESSITVTTTTVHFEPTIKPPVVAAAAVINAKTSRKSEKSLSDLDKPRPRLVRQRNVEVDEPQPKIEADKKQQLLTKRISTSSNSSSNSSNSNSSSSSNGSCNCSNTTRTTTATTTKTTNINSLNNEIARRPAACPRKNDTLIAADSSSPSMVVVDAPVVDAKTFNLIIFSFLSLILFTMLTVNNFLKLASIENQINSL